MLWGFVPHSCMPKCFLEEFFGFGDFAFNLGHIEETGFGSVESVFIRELRDCCYGAYVGGVLKGLR